MGTIRTSNLVRAFATLRDQGELTLTEAARLTGLSRPTVEMAFNYLNSRGIAQEGPDLHHMSGAGRPAKTFSMRTDSASVVGVDVGIRQVRALVADLRGRVTARAELPLATGAVSAERIAVVGEVVKRVVEAGGFLQGSLAGVGVGVSGLVDDDGRVIASQRISDWVGRDLTGELQHALGCPVVVENDVNLAALAEQLIGVGEGTADLLYLSLGHRLSMGLILDGRIRRGFHFAAGELTASTFPLSVDADGDMRWSAALGTEELFRLAGAGDAAANAEIVAVVEAVADRLATVSLALDPQAVVIGGGVARAGVQLLEPLEKAMRAHLPLFALPEFRLSSLDTDAVAIGALARAYSRSSHAVYGHDVPNPRIRPLRTAGVALAH